MGWPMRWLRGLLSDGGRRKAEGDRNAKSGRDKKGWVFARSFRDKDRGGGPEVARRTGVEEKKEKVAARSFRGPTAVGDRDQQNKRAIAVAAATAAAAEAAVAAAQAAAAAAVVRLRGKGGRAISWQSTEDCAAVKIQAAFRGYLARRALRALKGLVKLQALVRGHMVRKQAVETLRCMQALMRAQSRARAIREIRNSLPANKGSSHHLIPLTPMNRESKVRTNGARAVRSASVGGNGARAKRMDANSLQSSGCNWLDRWMEERYWVSREAPSRTCTANNDERNEKILEVDAGRPHLNAKRRNNQNEICSSRTSDRNGRSYMTVPDSPSKDSTTAQYSVPSPSSVCMQRSNLLGFPYEEEDICQSPQFFSTSSRTGSSMRGRHTLLKSECSQSYLTGFSDYPNYMSNTESSRAKLRSHSAPRQRPEFEKSGSVKRTLAIGRGDDDLSSTASQRSSLHQKFTRKTYLWKAG